MNELQAKFGELLKLERERRGIALNAVSAELKINEDSLTKIESGQVDFFPQGPYFALFSKSYAEFLGIDYAKTIEAIREELGESLEPEAPEGALREEPSKKDEKPVPERGADDLRTSRKGIGLVVAGSFVVIICLVAVYAVFFKNDKASPNPGDHSSADSTFVWHEVTENQAPVVDSMGDSAGILVSDSLKLTITAHDGSWATVLADDDTALFQMLSPGRPYNVSADERLVVTIGVPEVVDVLLDGYPAHLVDAATGDISRVLITHENRDQFFVQPEIDSAGDSATRAGDR